MTISSKRGGAPLSDAVVAAAAQLVDDAQEEGYREPSHSDLEFLIEQAELLHADPRSQGHQVGKAKRIRAVLRWAYENDPTAGEQLVSSLISTIQGLGGFRSSSPNYVGKQAIENLSRAFRAEGYELDPDGTLRPTTLDSLSGRELTGALRAYVRRAQEGVLDAALLAGTGKDLLEAVAAHVLVEKGSSVPNTNFPGLLGQAFVALDMKTPQDPVKPGEPSESRFERALYELGCAVNTLRNKEGTGHGRPFLPQITSKQAKRAVEAMGVIAGYILDKLEMR